MYDLDFSHIVVTVSLNYTELSLLSCKEQAGISRDGVEELEVTNVELAKLDASIQKRFGTRKPF